MAVQVIREVPSKFFYEETVVGLRMPKTNEMKAIAKKRSEYLKTVRADIIADKRDEIETGMNHEGDSELLIELQREVSALLCCDPENADIPWFAQDAAEQKTLAAQNVHKQLAEELPANFHSVAFQVFTVASASAQAVDFTKKDDEQKPGDPNNAPLEDETTTESLITSGSDDKSQTSQNTTASTQSETLEVGATTSS